MTGRMPPDPADSTQRPLPRVARLDWMSKADQVVSEVELGYVIELERYVRDMRAPSGRANTTDLERYRGEAVRVLRSMDSILQGTNDSVVLTIRDRIARCLQAFEELVPTPCGPVEPTERHMQEETVTMADPTDNQKLVVAFIAGHPGKLRLDAEIRDIKEKILQKQHRDRMEVHPVPAARSQDVLDTVTARHPQVIHFSGHGRRNPPGLYFESKKDGPLFVSTQAIEQLFATVASETTLVVLNVCYSEDQAVAIAKHVDCVIGTRDAIDDEDAIDFAVALYAAITDNCSVRTAFDAGKVRLAMEGKDDDIVCLHTRDGVDPAKVFLLPNPQ